MFMPRCPGNSIGFQIMRVCRRPDKIIYIYIYSAACLRIDIQDLFWTVSQVAVDLERPYDQDSETQIETGKQVTADHLLLGG